jgi:hypothetical protein
VSITIKRPETVELVRKLVQLRGEGLTQTIHEVLSCAYERAAADAAELQELNRAERIAKMRKGIAALQARVATYKVVDPRPWKKILYDENGLPQ